jgi:hypothetical protein
MATVDSAAQPILPRPGVVRRSRRPAAVPMARSVPSRRRAAKATRPGLSGERIDTLLLQGMICLAMGGMVLWFHAPLGAALRALI